MKRILAGLLMMAGAAGCMAQAPHKWAVEIHGGAGVIERKSMTPAREKAYRAGMQEALDAAAAVLDKGGKAVDAVEAAIKLLEDNPLFNAGRGAVFAADGTNQMDSAIMDGSTMAAGAVADTQTTRHPISLARAVMEHSGHVMLVGKGADQFAREQGLEQQPASFFFTEERWQQLGEEMKEKGLSMPARPAGAAEPTGKPMAMLESKDAHKWGTVGVVALDRAGNVAAGTSTGGLTAKRWNRVGDTPVIGAGTYASNQSCAVSATGTGEYFIRLTVARTICALVEYKGMRLQEAADEVIQKKLTAMHGDGGIIALTPDGQMAWSFNSPGMFRARKSEVGASLIGIYRDEP